jgi:hypothetical protein
MTDEVGTRPVLHCYFVEHFLMTTREAADTRAKFVKFAQREGYKLGSIFMETAESAPDAFTAMVNAVVMDQVTVLAVPTMWHFSVVGGFEDVKRQLETHTGARVLIMSPPP